MIDQSKSLMRWLESKWRNASPALKILYFVLALALLSLVVATIPNLSTLKEWFLASNPLAQSVVLIALVLLSIGGAILAYERGHRVDRLKVNNAQMVEELARRSDEVGELEKEVEVLENRWERMAEVEANQVLWRRPCTSNVPNFVAIHERPTRFLSVLNLKGGVGKTTLSANLSACLAFSSKPLRVLLVDIDFQGTLSDCAVDPQLIELQTSNENTVECLLSATYEPDLIRRLTVPMNRVPGVRVIIANDRLEAADFRLQAQFFLNPEQDVRFLFRQQLHQQQVFKDFDLVVFDCPPRLTTSTINALSCSDYVLIPTRLDLGSVNAVPRTIQWLNALAEVVRARIIGVVANHAAHRLKALTKQDQNNYTYLCQVVRSYCGANEVVFKTTVKADAHAVSPDRGSVASIEPEYRTLFESFVSELRGKLLL